MWRDGAATRRHERTGIVMNVLQVVHAIVHALQRPSQFLRARYLDSRAATARHGYGTMSRTGVTVQGMETSASTNVLPSPP